MLASFLVCLQGTSFHPSTTQWGWHTLEFGITAFLAAKLGGEEWQLLFWEEKLTHSTLYRAVWFVPFYLTHFAVWLFCKAGWRAQTCRFWEVCFWKEGERVLSLCLYAGILVLSGLPAGSFLAAHQSVPGNYLGLPFLITTSENMEVATALSGRKGE